MIGIPNDIYTFCRNVLGKCSEFDTHRSLQAIFITEKLRPFSSGLPEATNRNERVDLCLNYLLQNRHSSGESIFPIFLEVLRDRYPEENALHEELNECMRKAELYLIKKSEHQAKTNDIRQHKPRPTLEETIQGAQPPDFLEQINLLGSQKKQFCEALMDAFRSQKALEMMLSYELDWKLNQIAGGDNYGEIVFSLIDYAEAQGQLIKFLEAAKRANPGNSKLRNFYLQF